MITTLPQNEQMERQAVDTHDFAFSEMKDIAALENAILKQSTLYANEEATKQGLILPMISLMGYDVHNVNEIYPEYSIEELGRADYVLRIEGVFKQVIEAKRLNKPMLRYIPQIKSYFDSVDTVNLGLLTDGNHYMFFTDLEEKGKMDAKPFLVISTIHNFRNERVSLLWELYRLTRFDKDYTNAQIIAADSEYLSAYQEVMKNYKDSPYINSKERKGLSQLLGI